MGSAVVVALTPARGWRHVPVDGVPRWLSPAPGEGVASQPVLFSWSVVPGAEAYRLSIGTRPGAHDLLRSGWMRQTDYRVDELPSGQTLYARVFARRAAVRTQADLSFLVSPLVAEWVYPQPGSANVDSRRAFEWTPVPGADEYMIAVGTKPGRPDVVRLSAGRQTRMQVDGLPIGRRLLARISTRLGSRWRSRDADFALGVGQRPARLTYPRPHQTVNLSRPFVWSAVPLASAYRLRIGSAPAESDLYDTGQIGVTRRFVAGLPPSRVLFATLTTIYPDRTLETHRDFQVKTGTPQENAAVQAALAATAAVREMAGDDVPWPRTILEQVARRFRVSRPSCVEYAYALLQALSEQDNPLPSRPFNSCLLGNLYDCHTLVELYRPSRGTWMLLDPTFAVAVRRRRDGDWATAADVTDAVRREDWHAVSFIPLTADSIPLLKSYYIDYPLLFVSPFGEQPPTPEGGPSILRYYREVPLPIQGSLGCYAVRCLNGAGAKLLIDRRLVTLTCRGHDRLSEVRAASWLELPPGHRGEVKAYRLRRFVF